MACTSAAHDISVWTQVEWTFNILYLQFVEPPAKSHYGQGEALIHPYNRGVRANIRVYKEGVRVG